MTYAPLGVARFRIVNADAGEMLVIPTQRNVFVILFLMAWLGGWTLAGLEVVGRIFGQFHPFLAFWSVGWALGWMFAVMTLAWMLTGKENVRMIGRDLEVGYSMWGIRRRKLYRGADVKGLSVAPVSQHAHARSISIPFFGKAQGAVWFSYGARTQSFGLGLDPAEAEEIIAWLRKRLPDA